MKQQMIMEKSWSELPSTLLESISDRLPLVDYISFRGVCHPWRSAPSGRFEITNFSKKSLWSLFYGCQTNNNGGSSNDNDSKCYLYSQSYPKSCIVYLPHLHGATIVYSNSGWLLVHRNDHFFFYNPFTLKNIDLPKHAIAEDQVYAFTVEPTNPNCVVFIVSRWKDSELVVSSYTVGDRHRNWTMKSLEVNKIEIDRMMAVAWACSCKIIGGNSCVCGCNNHIFIGGRKNCVIFDTARNLCFRGNCREDSTKSQDSSVTDLCQQMDSPCHKDWLHKFGENGILVSFCAISLCRLTAKKITYPAGTKTFKVDDDQVEDKLNLVKATWIEPTFGGK